MTPDEHRARAEELLADAERIETPHRRTPETRDRLIAEAQLHATLALGARRPRITNHAQITRPGGDVVWEGLSRVKEQRAATDRLIDLLTSEPALAAFREAWLKADEEGAEGDRVRRGMIAAIEAVS